jgi:ABC-2 type transport system ATP-binding protein
MDQLEHTPPIEAHDLVKTYGKGKSAVRALQGVSFGARAGTVLGLLGPNGAGKSTVVRILTTLSAPDSGIARVAGFDVVREPNRVRRTIGVVGQRGAVDADATGRENLALQGRLYGLDARSIRTRSAELLDRFSLSDAADRIVRTWSGGMQRKLDVAIGLIHRPRVLFLDEPTTGLDPEARADLWTEIERLTADGMTLLLTTHYLEEADRLADEVAIIDRGRIVASGAPQALKSELRGDALMVELRDAPANGEATIALGNVHGMRDATVDGRFLRARADDGAAAVPAVLAALDRAGLGVAAVTVARPSLDDVYFQHTGRAYRRGTQEAVR